MFESFGKIARLSREVVITEKIDGTNAQVYIVELADDAVMPTDTPIVAVVGNLLLYAASRTRMITPQDDNYGFASWVKDHAETLARLGPGRHFGEWWGRGIQRNYAQQTRRFSLFNVSRWHEAGAEPYITTTSDPKVAPKASTELPEGLRVVPVLYRGPMDEHGVMVGVKGAMRHLKNTGSAAAPGFMQPEGIVIFHTASGQMFKKTIEKDAEPKGRSA